LSPIAVASGADDPIDDQISDEHCGDSLPSTREGFCVASVRGLANSLNPYGTEQPDTLRERYATNPVCAICQCGVEPIPPESDANQLASVRKFLAISPKERLGQAIEEGDLRFLGVPDFSGMYVPCYGHSASAEMLNVVPQTLNVQLSEEHAELNKRVYEYARQYNYLLGNWLVCSGDIPLPEDSRQRLGIRCDK
jgi:hypothetical protein